MSRYDAWKTAGPPEVPVIDWTRDMLEDSPFLINGAHICEECGLFISRSPDDDQSEVEDENFSFTFSCARGHKNRLEGRADYYDASFYDDYDDRAYDDWLDRLTER